MDNAAVGGQDLIGLGVQGLALVCWMAVVALGYAAWRRRRGDDAFDLLSVGGVWLAARAGLLIAGLSRAGQPGADWLNCALDLTGLILLVWPFLAPPLPNHWADRLAGVGLITVALACGMSVCQRVRSTMGLSPILRPSITGVHSTLVLAGTAALNLPRIQTRRRYWWLTIVGACLAGIGGTLMPLRLNPGLTPIATAAMAALSAAWLNCLERPQQQHVARNSNHAAGIDALTASRLLEASDSLFAATDAEELLEAVTGALQQILEVRSTALLLTTDEAEENGETLQMRLIARWPRTDASQASRHPTRECSSILMGALARGHAVNLARESDRRCLQALETVLEHEPEAALILPLLPPSSHGCQQAKGRVLVVSHTGAPPDALRLHMCQILADQAAIVAEYIHLCAKVGPQSRIADLEERCRQLELEANQLRESDRLKCQLIANLSHELRTPLNSIIGFSGVMLKGIDGELTDTQYQDMEAIYKSGRHLLGLITDILDISQLWAGKMELALGDVDLREVVEDAITMTTPLIDEKPIELVQALAPDLPTIRADRTRVRQLLLNLLTNAMKYTEEGQVTVSAVCDEDYVLVSVSDSGIGISPEDSETIFEEFGRVDNLKTRQAGGLGLGLAISRQLVELQGGRIWVESTVGVGSTFHFTLPVAGPPSDAEQRITHQRLEAALAQWR